jgi:hypothetical protein
LVPETALPLVSEIGDHTPAGLGSRTSASLGESTYFFLIHNHFSFNFFSLTTPEEGEIRISDDSMNFHRPARHAGDRASALDQQNQSQL